MTQPLNRNASLPPLGDIDSEAGEFWVTNPFEMPVNGMNLSAYERNRMFLNVDGGLFVDASFASRADIDSDSRAVVSADFDRDGRPDLLVASVGGGPLRLFSNRFPESAHRVRIELVGVQSNRPGIGSRVTAEVGGRRLVRDIFPGNGGVGQAPAELILGVGPASKLDRLTIRWPSGQLQRFTDLAVDVRLTFTEGSSDYEISPLKARH